MRFWMVFLMVLTIGIPTILAQTDSLLVSSDSSKKIQLQLRKIRDPRRASLLSAILPGAGQLYNRKYWKLPIIYGGAFLMGYYIHFNNEQYVINRNQYLLVQSGQPNTSRYSPDQLVRLREYWRRNRDFLVIISALVYLLNIADAAVDAHFSTFDVSDDLSLKWKPEINFAGRQPVFGVGLAINFK